MVWNDIPYKPPIVPKLANVGLPPNNPHPFCLNDRIFVATWNVAGKSPPNHLSLDDWLPSSTPADIYVLGCVLQLRIQIFLKDLMFV